MARMTYRLHLAALAALVGTVAILAGCGGGGSSAPQTPQALPTAINSSAPSAGNRTAVGTATLSLSYPNVLHAAAATQVLRATGSASTRQPDFIDPSPQPLPSAGTTYNVLDIFVDGTHQVNLDSSGTSHSVTVNQAGNGAQTISIPLYSYNANQIVAVEYDPTGATLLALGETDLGTFVAGTAQNITLTMALNATGIGIVDFPSESHPTMMSSSGTMPYTAYPHCTAANFGFYPTDALNDLLPSAGAGTGAVPTISGTSDGGGTSSIGQGSVGLYQVHVDGAHDGVSVIATVANPAFQIYNNVANSNYAYYYDNFYYSDGYSVPYQGIWDLAYIYGQLSAFFQTSTPTLNRYIDITGC